ncbi:MAG: META domain-containing protein [Tannerellaceae bacterium]|nr:META domain-containing protein [Tannerellaceae bacterium]
MKKTLLYMVLLPVAALMVACSDSKVDVNKLDGTWTITEVNGTKIQQENMPFIEFNTSDDKIHGNAGCNIFNSTFSRDNEDVSVIRIAPGTTTMMACPHLETEDKVLKGIQEITRVKMGKHDKQMYLVGTGDNVILVLEKAD